MRTRKYCIDCGAKKAKDQSPPSPFWCATCEIARRERIGNSFMEIKERLEKKSSEVKNYD